MTGTRRPSSWDLTAARDKTIPDVAGPGLRVLFSGINPGLYSAATGYHFARPGNRFWPALYAAGFTERVLRPEEQEELLTLGLGITNVVARATARADELTADEVRAGGRVLTAKVARLRPQWLAVVGITVYRTAFGHPGGGDRAAGRDAGRCPGLGAAQPQRPQRALGRRRPGRRVRPACWGRCSAGSSSPWIDNGLYLLGLGAAAQDMWTALVLLGAVTVGRPGPAGAGGAVGHGRPQAPGVTR